jgi:penicillin-binding protein 1C
VSLRAEGGSALRWRVDGREFARGADAGWMPWPGRHVLQLVDAGGQVADEVRVEVRGAAVKTSAARGGR